MSVHIDVASQVSDELLEALNRLLPQLSSRASELDASALEALLAQECLTLLVARHEGRLVGALSLVLFEIPTGTRAWIEDVVVEESARGLGVGEALTRGALELARARGAGEVDLTSRPSREAANSLYQKVGFVARETNVYRIQLD